MNISTNLAKLSFTYSLAMGMQKRFYRLDALTSSKVLWNLRGTKILSQEELELAPQYLYKALSAELDKKVFYNVDECLENMKIVFSAITKQKTLFDVKEPFSHEEISKFYSDEEIQILLEKISLFATHLFKTDPKKALNLIENGLKMRSDLPTSEISIKLKSQYVTGLILQKAKTIDETKNYLLNLASDAENSAVLPSVMASIRSLQGFVALREAMVISKAEYGNGYRLKTSVKKFAEVKHTSKMYFQEATRLEPENKMHRVNEFAVGTFLFGAYISASKIEVSRRGTIKVIPTLENFLNSGHEWHDDRRISIAVYQKLAVLRDEIASSKFAAYSPFLNAPLKALENEKPLPAEKGEIVVDKPVETIPQEPKTVVEVLTKTRAKRNTKKITRE